MNYVDWCGGVGSVDCAGRNSRLLQHQLIFHSGRLMLLKAPFLIAIPQQ